MSIYSKQSSRLPRCCLSYFLEAARWPRSGSLSRLSALSVDSPYAEMEPRSRTERGRENRPGLWPILPNAVCRRLATLARVSKCVAPRSTVCPLSARPHATATQITKFPPSCARHAHLAGTTVTARRRRAAPPCAASRDDREQRSRVAPARQKRWLLMPAGRRRVCTKSARQLRV